MVNNKRRDILKLSALAAAGFLLPSATTKAASWLNGFDESAAKRKKFGLQLYGIRNILGKDPKNVLKQVAALGYTQIESFEHQQLGVYMGLGNKGFKSYAKSLGMSIPSVHVNIYKDFEKKVAEAAEINVKYLIYNWEGPGKTMDDYKRMADDFNKKGEYCKQHGINFAFHNHDFTFKKIGNDIPQEWLMEHTDPNLVDFQIDFYWVEYAGQNSIEWVKKYPSRFKLCHFKDRSKTSNEREKSGIVELGTGTINFQNILDQIKQSSIKYYIVDQDTCNDREDPLECLKIDAAYMQQLRF